MATVKANLIAAKALIDTPAKWGKGKGATPPANCHCIVTAAPTSSTVRELEQFLPGGPDAWGNADSSSVIAFNDHPDTTHADIMALFDRAIAAQDEDRLQTRDQMLRGLSP